MSQFQLSKLEAAIVGRDLSIFSDDITDMSFNLSETIKGSRILCIGAAGSIGSQTLKAIAQFKPKTLHVVDHNENGLAELIRSIRSSSEKFEVDDMLTMPLDYGSSVFNHWLSAQREYDYILNFAALKHVRSEKDPYSILGMIDTNVLKLANFADQISTHKNLKRLFCVSTDKAANPSSMMGATKRLMEHALFSSSTNWPKQIAITSARFANVALSNGSLLQSWQLRLQQRQPMACPKGCKRFFVSMSESGQLCMLASMLGEQGNIFIPSLYPEEHLMPLQDVIVKFLALEGLEPYFTEDEVFALSSVEELAQKGKWPVLLTPLDTAGEKPYEEFVGKNEVSIATKFKSLHRVPYIAQEDSKKFTAFLEHFRGYLSKPASTPLSIEELKDQISLVETEFANTHVVSKKSLDQRI